MESFEKKDPNGKFCLSYIEKHWSVKTDNEMADHLGINPVTIRSIRRRYGWLKRGKMTKSMKLRRRNNIIHEDKRWPRTCFDYLAWLKGVIKEVGTDQKALEEFRRRAR